MNEKHLAGRLRRAGLRSTFPRLAVLKTLSENPGFPRADDIHRRLYEGGVPLNIDTVYRVLRELRAVRLVLILQDVGRTLRYCLHSEAAAPLLRLICRDGGARDRLTFSDPELHARILAIAARQGLKLEGRKFDLQVRPERRDAESSGSGRRTSRG